MSQSVRVRLQGREYSLRSQQSAEQVQAVAAFVEQQLAEVSRVSSVDTQDAMALTLLNLAGQYLQLRSNPATLEPGAVERIEKLIRTLEDELEGSSS